METVAVCLLLSGLGAQLLIYVYMYSKHYKKEINITV
jgi:hypothetical protein